MRANQDQAKQDQNSQDLNWLAFCYVVDELSPADALSFEERLASDQAAREALAEAVLLTQALAAVPSDIEVSRKHDRTRHYAMQKPLGWIAIGAAACLALVVLADGWLAKPKGVRTAANKSNESLALAWANSTLAMEPEANAETDMLLAGLDDGDTAIDLDNPVVIPNWMLEAVSAPGTALPNSALPNSAAPAPREES